VVNLKSFEESSVLIKNSSKDSPPIAATFTITVVVTSVDYARELKSLCPQSKSCRDLRVLCGVLLEKVVVLESGGLQKERLSHLSKGRRAFA
jgi:hypothetical protein